MKRYIRKYRFLIIFFLCAILFITIFDFDGQKSTKTDKHYSYDSALIFLKLGKGEYEVPVGNTLIYKDIAKDTSGEFEKLSELYLKKAKSENNAYALSYYQMIWSRNLLEKVGFDSFKKAQLFAVNQANLQNDTNLLLSAISNLSTVYLMNSEHDSGLYYTKLGYDLSVNANNNRFIFFYSINMGYVMNGDQLYGAAQMYFEQALAVSKKLYPRNNVLLNNLLSVMITEENYQQAEEFWKEHFNNYDIDETTYEGQLIIINRAFLFQNQNKWTESRVWINKLKNLKSYDELKLNVIRLKLRQIDHENGSYSQYLNENRPFIFESYPYSFVDLEDFLTKELTKNPSFLSLDDILKLEQEKAPPGPSEKMTMAAVKRIKALCYENVGDFKTSNMLNKEAMKYRWEFDALENKLRHTDLSEKLRLSKLFEKIEKQKINIAEREQEKRIYQAFTILLILISLLILYTIFKQRKNTNLREQLLMQELENEKILAENLVRENDLNNRIVTLSKLIISKVDVVNKLLSGINESNFHSGIKEVRTEFLSIQNAVSDAQPQLADKLLEDYSNIQQDFPDVVTLSITEKRIFVLSINGYQTKEIAGLLGLTSQYVNNARTSVRKKLNIEENWKEVLLNKKNPNLRSSE